MTLHALIECFLSSLNMNVCSLPLLIQVETAQIHRTDPGLCKQVGNEEILAKSSNLSDPEL